LATVEQRLVRLKSVPTGPQAVQVAERMAQAFVKENEFGLYRGEVLVELAEYALERELLPEKGMRRYTQAWAWLEQVGAMDAALESFDVPGKAKAVSAPPAVEEKQDYFGNFKREGIQIGAVVNRRTCGWYLDDLREKTALAMGFLEFCKKRQEAALAWFDKVVALDQKTGYLQSRGEWNNYRRMKWGAENGYLYAYPQELSLYGGRQRFAVLLGDFYYCTERFATSQEIAERLLTGELGKLTPREREYPQYLLGSSLYWTRGRKEAFLAYEKILEKREGTFTEDRAAFAAANISPFTRDAEMIERGYMYLDEIATSNRKNEYTLLARLNYGWRMLETEKEETGIKILQAIAAESEKYRVEAEYYIREALAKREAERKQGR
jgi:hypothetical protein